MMQVIFKCKSMQSLSPSPSSQEKKLNFMASDCYIVQSRGLVSMLSKTGEETNILW